MISADIHGARRLKRRIPDGSYSVAMSVPTGFGTPVAGLIRTRAETTMTPLLFSSSGLGTVPSPKTPAFSSEAPMSTGTPRHIPGLTPELRAALPSGSLMEWTSQDVARCLRVLGREFAAEGNLSERDVTAFEVYADEFLAAGVDGPQLANMTLQRLRVDLGVGSHDHRAKIFGWVRQYLQDKMPDSPNDAPVIAASSPDAKDDAIAHLTVKLHEMQTALFDAQERAGTSPARQPGPSNENDERLTAALAEANERMLRYSEDATRSHEAMMRTADENERLAAAIARYDETMPELKSSNERLREETVATLARLQTQFAATVARIQAETKATLSALEQEKDYQERRNGKLHLRNRALLHKIQDLKGAIRVYTRIRPLQTNDPHGESMVVPGRCLDPAAEGMDAVCKPAPVAKLSNTGERRPAGKRLEEKRFSFDRVFGPDSTQSDVYEEVSPVVMGVLDGYNACVFAYGQTGSGKTYTMGGPDGASQHEELVGINDRALTELFETARARGETDGVAYTIAVEMREIYNEQVRDLLRRTDKDATWNGVTEQPRFHERRPTTSSEGTDDSDVEVTRVTARDAAHVLEIMAEGTARRASGETKMNERSSRSHSVVTVYVEGSDAAMGAVKTGMLHLIDLAGSERVARSEATGDRLKEAQHINKSLSALGDVIAALLEKRTHVPFRNSQLTRLLSDSLGGNSKVVLLAHVSPEAASLPETQSTLLFAQRCSQVELGKAKVNATGGGGSSEAAMTAVAKYKGELETTKSRAARAEAEAAALREELAELKRRQRIPSREPLSPVSRNHGSEIASSATPSMPPPQSATKKAISRAALTAASSILNSKY